MPLQRKRINIREQRGLPAYSVTEHLQHIYIHRQAHAHTHIQVTCKIHAHAHTAIVYYDSLQLTSSMQKAKDNGQRAHGQKEIMHAYQPKSTPLAQGPMEDINAMHAYGRSSAPIAQGLVYDINASHAFGLRESKPNAMHAYERSSAPIAQGLVYDINAPHAFGLRESKRTYGPASTPIAQGLVAIINAKDQKIVMSPKAQGLVSNTHHGKEHMLKNCTHDRMSGGKAAKRSNSGATAKKMPFSDATNHAAVSFTPKEDDSSQWVSALAPLTLLKATSKHADELNENRMLYNVSDATKGRVLKQQPSNNENEVLCHDHY